MVTLDTAKDVAHPSPGQAHAPGYDVNGDTARVCGAHVAVTAGDVGLGLGLTGDGALQDDG